MRIWRGRCGTSKVGAIGVCGEGEAGNQQQPQPDRGRKGQKLDICAQRRRRSGGNKVRSRQSAPSRWFTAAPILTQGRERWAMAAWSCLPVFPFSFSQFLGAMWGKKVGAPLPCLSLTSALSAISAPAADLFRRWPDRCLNSTDPIAFILLSFVRVPRGSIQSIKPTTPRKIDHIACCSRFLRGRGRGRESPFLRNASS